MYVLPFTNSMSYSHYNFYLLLLVHVRMYICMKICRFLCVFVCECVCMHICIVYACMYVLVCMYGYVGV